ETVRASDVAARLGGDEFAVLFVGAREDTAEAAAQRLLARLLRIGELYPGLNLGASVGMALYTAPAGSAEEMIRAADAAMYEAKRRGRGRVVLSQPGAEAEAASPTTH
ncbi:MAG TPA: GGDEF domain-containing protein, partial [Myxococcales bacterium]|nr:GGDEF domain-containing protein [Myxococcales bacterium]